MFIKGKKFYVAGGRISIYLTLRRSEGPKDSFGEPLWGTLQRPAILPNKKFIGSFAVNPLAISQRGFFFQFVYLSVKFASLAAVAKLVDALL